MSEYDRSSAKQNILMQAVRILSTAVTRLFSRVLIPVVKDIWFVAIAMLRPLIRMLSHGTVTSVRSLHSKKHWSKRFGVTFWGNAVGLAIAMISAQLITQFIEVRGVENLWGLFSRRVVVSEEGFRVLSFVAEFIITLVVFSGVEYFMDQRRRNKQDMAAHDGDGGGDGMQ